MVALDSLVALAVVGVLVVAFPLVLEAAYFHHVAVALVGLSVVGVLVAAFPFAADQEVALEVHAVLRLLVGLVDQAGPFLQQGQEGNLGRLN